MLKKAGLLTVGVTAGLLAVAPIASAGVSDDHDSDRDREHSKHDDDRDKKDNDRDKDRDKKWDKDSDGDQDGTGNIQCDADGGDLSNDAEGGLVGQVTGPVLSGNTGQLLSCNSFLNDILNDNEVNVLS